LNLASVIAVVGLCSYSSVSLAQGKGKGEAPPEVPAACGTAKITKKLEKPMNAALKAREAKDWQGMLAHVREANAIEVEKTEYDKFWMHELNGIAYTSLKQYPEAIPELDAALKSPCMTEADKPARNKILMQMTYQGKDYAKAIEYGKTANQLVVGDPEVGLYLGNAYYLVDDFANARATVQELITRQETNGKVPDEQSYRILQSACLKLKDDACVVEQIEKLVRHHPKPEYWVDLTNSLLRVTKSDKEILNVLRLADGVDVMNTPAQYTEYAQLSMAQGLPGEAQAILEKGMQKKVFDAAPRERDRANRLIGEAKQAAALDKSTLDKQDASARAKPTGESDVKLGAAYLSYGQNDKAIESLQRGLGKGGVKSPDEAGLLLGMAYVRSNNNAEAAKAFKTVTKDPALARIAKLWLLKVAPDDSAG
jgi:tetratricopeptide (TPR) repeat protein